LFFEVAKLRPPESRFGSQVVEMLMFVMSSGGPLVIWGRDRITDLFDNIKRAVLPWRTS
jgi:hypothetical protein